LLVHADNSAGLASFAHGSPFNAVRVGLLQFGVPPYPKSLLGAVQTEPVLSFHTRISIVKQLPSGTSVGYGRTRVLSRPTTTAVIAAGYGDGIPRAASNRGFVLIRGKRCPVLGRVSMDQTVVDVTDVPGVEHGDAVVLIGKQGDEAIDSVEFSEWGDTIAWETLCSISKRVPRLYRTTLGL
jgi:alanine racemase